jgi:GrpB-like predicted nucleotidyltransferase (UPF0157 family)
VARKIILLLALVVLPGALSALCFLLFARVLARTPRGRRILERVERRLPQWAVAPLHALQGKTLPRLGETSST